jgi:hypothetical protein
MEEKIKITNFDEWIKNYKPPEIRYLAGYDPLTGRVLVVGPEHAVKARGIEYTIEIPAEQAEAIVEGKIYLDKCFVDPEMEQLEIVEQRDLYKIDDVLHRVIEKPWAEDKRADLFVTYSKDDKSLSFQLSKEYNGTYQPDPELGPVAKRKMFWKGDTELNFLITGYNDPHEVYREIKLTIGELDDNTVVVNDIDPPEEFSIYTKRVLKHYLMEKK